MGIHHAVTNKAFRMGVTITEDALEGRFTAFNPANAISITSSTAKGCLDQMQAALRIKSNEPDVSLVSDGFNGTIGTTVFHLKHLTQGVVSKQSTTPIGLLSLYTKDEIEWIDPVHEAAEGHEEVDDEFEEDDENTTRTGVIIKRAEDGTPLDGAIAYAEGVVAACNPFEADSNEAKMWDTQWDQAADEATPSEDNEEDVKGGSVVASKYRTRYTEAGHPTHCGDWLANLLNGYCAGKTATDLETFEHICSLNGVDTSKYRRSGTGWQGRIRMTGRNLLARRVFNANAIVLPDRDAPGNTITLTPPDDWKAAQRFVKAAAK